MMLLPKNMGRLLNCANGEVYAFKTLSLIASFAMYKKNTIVLFLA
jgi:hypothetical protein